MKANHIKNYAEARKAEYPPLEELADAATPTYQQITSPMQTTVAASGAANNRINSGMRQGPAIDLS